MRGSRSLHVWWVALAAILVSLLMIPAVALAEPTEPDTYESDNTSAEAVTITTDGVKQEHSLYPAYDIDWQRFTAVTGHRYLIQTGPGASEPTTNNDFYIRLYGADGTTQLAYNDDGGPENYSYLYWTATTSGTLYIKNHAWNNQDYIGFYAIRVTDLTASGAHISGTVRAAGAPAAGATVWFATDGDPWLTALEPAFRNYDFANTLANGTYNAPVTEGTQTVSFGGDRYFTQWYEGVSKEASATQFSLAFGATRTGVDANLTLKPAVERVAGSCAAVSVNTSGNLGDHGSVAPAASTTGRFVVFESAATNLWTGVFDGEGSDQVYVRDRATGVTTSESRAADGSAANNDCWNPDISGDGRYVVFTSSATNLPGAQTDNIDRIFLRDRVSNETTCVSVRPDAVPTSAHSGQPSISEDGRFVAYDSNDSELVSGDENGARDVFVWDRVNGTTVRASVDGEGVEGAMESYAPSIDAGGRYVAFVTWNAWAPGDNVSDSSDALDIYVKDLTTKAVVRASVPISDTGIGESRDPSISRDGRHVAFQSYASWLVAGDTNDVSDIFLRDLDAGTTVCVSRPLSGGQANNGSADAAISGDGSTVVFQSSATNMVANDNNESQDVFVRDYGRGRLGMVSVAPDGLPGNRDSYYGTAISDDGSTIVFGSDASNLVANDDNESTDVFAVSYPYVPPVVAKPSNLTRPIGPYVSGRRSQVRFYGSLRPKHASGKRVVTLLCYRLEHGEWVLRRTGSTRTYNRRGWSFTKYAGRVRLGLRGRWKVVAGHKNADGTWDYSEPRYMRVR